MDRLADVDKHESRAGIVVDNLRPKLGDVSRIVLNGRILVGECLECRDAGSFYPLDELFAVYDPTASMVNGPAHTTRKRAPVQCHAGRKLAMH